MINVLLNENMPFEFIQLFEKFQFTAFHVKKLGKTGIRNGEIYQLAKECDTWMITRDRDFQNVVKFQTYQPKGIVFVKVKDSRTQVLLVLFKRLLENQLTLFEEQHLLMIEEETIKIIL